MSSTVSDFQLGLRTMRKRPAFALVCIVALSIGIGLTTLMFSLIYGALYKGLPFENGDRIVALYRTNPERDIERQDIPIQDYHDITAVQQSFAEMGGYTSGTMNVSGTDKAERYSGTWVTVGTLRMTGVQPVAGRIFQDGEDQVSGAKVAVIGYAIWRDRYGLQPSAVGSVIRINGQPFEIVGVMPEDFVYPDNSALWLPLQRDPLASARGEGDYLNTIGLLRDGVSMDQANVELATLSRRFAEEYPKENGGFVMGTLGFVERYIGDQPRQLLWTMLGAVFFVLLIACTNVANLLLDRAAHRTKEVGVRSALGASRVAIMRVFLSEAFVLALGGTVLGIVIAYVSIGIFNRAIEPTQPPFFIDIALHPPVLLFAIGVALVATLFSGLIPALQASRADIAEVLKDESRGASSLRIGRISRGLVIFEAALSCGLLVAAGLMIKSVVRAGTSDTGFATETVFTARVGFPVAYTDTMVQRQFYDQLGERIAALPGVQSAAIAAGLPGARQGLNQNAFALDGQTYERDIDYPVTRFIGVSPTFFETLEIPLRSGRLFTDADRLGNLEVAIVNERFVREYIGDGDPLGRRIRFGRSEAQQPWVTIVGVVPDLFAGDPEDPRPAVVFRPFSQQFSNFAYIAARSSGNPMALTDPVRQAVASLNPDIPIYWPMTLDKAIAEQLWFVRIFGTMFMIFGFVALMLAAIGLYAVMSFSVSRRTREVGIRMALGATARDVVGLVMKQGVWQLAVGLVIGLAVAAGVSQLLKTVLFDVQPLDPSVFGGVVLVLAAAGALATLLPAMRATRVDPSDAMRTE